MDRICVNSAVIERYVSGSTLNDAIRAEFGEVISDRASKNEAIAKMTPLQIVMLDAGITKSSKLGDMMSPKNSAYTSGGMDTNQWLFPAWVDTTLREALYEQDLLSYIASTAITMDGNTVQSPMLNLMSPANKKGIKKARIAEGADLPTGKITIGEKAITLWKHGRAIELTYEAARRMRVDLFTRQMAAIVGDLAHQNLEFAIDVLADGDGNDGTAATQLGTTATAGQVSSDELVGAMVDYYFANHFNATTMVMSKAYLKAVSKMVYDPTLARGASLQIAFNIPQIGEQKVTLLGTDEVKINGKDVILLLNKDLTLTRYEENGSNIQEMDNYIRNQMKLMTMSENSGYGIGVAGSNMYLAIKSST